MMRSQTIMQPSAHSRNPHHPCTPSQPSSTSASERCFLNSYPRLMWRALAAHTRSCARRWLIVAFHEPYYTTQSSPALATYFKQHLEQLFYSSAVDVIVNGHIHAYERSYPVFNNAVRTV